MKKTNKLSEKAFQLDGKMPLSQAIPLGLQHVLAMFVGNLSIVAVALGEGYGMGANTAILNFAPRLSS